MRSIQVKRRVSSAGVMLAIMLGGCAQQASDTAPTADSAAPAAPTSGEYYGTLEPIAADAIYFVLTDRFVNGDPSNDQREQGGAHPTFDIPLPPCDGVTGNIGYLGGDFRGLLDNADYIREMGFGAVWITPVIDNPDQAFSGGDPISCSSILSDHGKTGYHGYWGVNFFKLDEHLPSAGLAFRELTDGLRAKGLKTVLDIVGNHGSPGFGMSEHQPGFGQLFDAGDKLVADHGNLSPEQLDPANPLHAFYNRKPDLAQLSDLDADNPAVVDYLVGAYRHWIDEGADAFRVDTIRHQPMAFWKQVADRIRVDHPGFFMFGEAFDYEADNIAAYTWPENGGYSLLDFPMKKAINEVFTDPDSDYAHLLPALALGDGPFQNPYELTTFYDNHDMPRMQASDEGFIDAHNWLFTARGIPVIYYGSESGFMRGRAEHAGNRAYFGNDGIEAARHSRIREQLSRIAKVRAATPALQRGLQLNFGIKGQQASFLRVLQKDEMQQVALVLLNKGEAPATFALPAALPAGEWRNALGADSLQLDGEHAASVEIAAHDVGVWVIEAAVSDPQLRVALDALMARQVVHPQAAAAH